MTRSNKISFSVRQSKYITVPLVANIHSHAHCQPFEINANTETVAEDRSQYPFSDIWLHSVLTAVVRLVGLTCHWCI